MVREATNDVQTTVERIYRTESRRVLASLIRVLGDFDLAEEALHEAFTAAVEQWQSGVPANPRAWLVSAGRFKAIDVLRRRGRFDAALGELAQRLDREPAPDVDVEDDRLRLIFTCCHPALAQDTQVALTLREVCGLTTEEIASAFLTTPATLAQRIVRGKAKIRTAGIPYQVPSHKDLPERLDAVLTVVYLVFNEGYAASSGATLTRADLAAEAIRLGRLLVELLPDAEAYGLLALMLLQESRRAARTTADGDVILLEEQDRTLWDTTHIAEGQACVQKAFAAESIGVYAIQAAIASVHASSPTPEATHWPRIVELYDLLLTATQSAVVELNRAVAIAMRDGPAAGLALIDALLARGELADYPLAHAAKADLCRRMGDTTPAHTAYQRALELTKQEPQRRFLAKRLRELV